MSLQMIAVYGSDDEMTEEIDEIFMRPNLGPNVRAEKRDEDEEIEHIVSAVIESMLTKLTSEDEFHFETSNYRCTVSDDESDVSSISDLWSFSDSDIVDADSDLDGNQVRCGPCITKGELRVEELPPIERLRISVDIRELTQVGIVQSIVNQLVIVETFKNLPVLDLDSVLFCKDGSSLGQIFDVIGPVKQPDYVLRFNSAEEIAEYKLVLNSPIYYAEGRQQPITKYVFVQDLLKEKGSDASWKNDNEPPPEELDYSDDEVERAEKWKQKAKSRRK